MLQYDVKAKYRLISGKFSGMKYFSPEHSLNQPKATRVCIRSINRSNRFISVRFLFLFVSGFSFQGQRKIALCYVMLCYVRNVSLKHLPGVRHPGIFMYNCTEFIPRMVWPIWLNMFPGLTTYSINTKSKSVGETSYITLQSNTVKTRD